MGSFKIRTDLALEARENAEEEAESLSGVSVEEVYHEDSEVRITKVSITSKNSARALGKPMGTYITLEAPAMTQQDENYHQEISGELSMQLREIIPELEKESSILVVGLGNRDVTPDALGPYVVKNVRITRHLLKEYGTSWMKEKEAASVSGVIPGVMAQTGMETLEIIRGVVKESSPDLILVVDALAARSTRRLGRTIQLTDTGIHPGSGVGNYRSGINRQTLGIPVIAIGVPTVVDAATIVSDTMESLVETMDATEHMQNLGGVLGTLNRVEKHQMLTELISPQLNTMFVTPKDVDETVKRISYTISEGINLALLGPPEKEA